MIQSVCPFCGNELAVPDDLGGARGKCSGCGRMVTLPPAGSPPGQPAQAAPASGPVGSVGSEGPGVAGMTGWILGIVVPAALVILSIWLGFVRQDMAVSMGSRRSQVWDAQGPAAVWAGAGAICLAVAVHCLVFWAPKPRFRAPAIVCGVMAVVGMFVATFVAAVKQDEIEAHRKERLQQDMQLLEQQRDALERRMRQQE